MLERAGGEQRAVFPEIEELLRNQYSIGYTPARRDGSGKFQPTRAGYYSQ